jgi:hypothetical protein
MGEKTLFQRGLQATPVATMEDRDGNGREGRSGIRFATGCGGGGTVEFRG